MAYEETKTGGHEDKAREGSSTPAIETPAVGASADVRPRVAGGGGEGTKATTDEGAESSIQEVTVNEKDGPKRTITASRRMCAAERAKRVERVFLGRNGNTGGCGGHRSKEHRHEGRGRKEPFRKGYAKRSGMRNVQCGRVRATQRARER